MKITGVDDCGNSPKNSLVARCAVAFAAHDELALREMLAPMISWTVAGGPALDGIDGLLEALPQHLPRKARSVQILHALSHGRGGAVDGMVGYAGNVSIRFCHMIEFTSVRAAVIGSITSWFARSEVPELKGGTR